MKTYENWSADEHNKEKRSHLRPIAQQYCAMTVLPADVWAATRTESPETRREAISHPPVKPMLDMQCLNAGRTLLERRWNSVEHIRSPLFAPILQALFLVVAPLSRQLMAVRWKGSKVKGNSLAAGPGLAGGGCKFFVSASSGHATAWVQVFPSISIKLLPPSGVYWGTFPSLGCLLGPAASLNSSRDLLFPLLFVTMLGITFAKSDLYLLRLVPRFQHPTISWTPTSSTSSTSTYSSCQMQRLTSLDARCCKHSNYSSEVHLLIEIFELRHCFRKCTGAHVIGCRPGLPEAMVPELITQASSSVSSQPSVCVQSSEDQTSVNAPIMLKAASAP